MADTNLSKANKPSFGTRVKRFFKDTKAELKKVTWPDKEQLIHNTGVIIDVYLNNYNHLVRT